MTWEDILKKESRIEREIKDVLGNPTQQEYKMYEDIYEDGKSGDMPVDEYVEDYVQDGDYTQSEEKLVRYFYELGLEEKEP